MRAVGDNCPYQRSNAGMYSLVPKLPILRILCLFSLIFTLPASSLAAESSAKSKTSPSAAKGASKVDINTADAETLQTLPGVGPATAKAIIARRPFASVSELESVPGIGSAKLADLRDQVTASRTMAKKETSAKAEKEKTETTSRSEKASRTASDPASPSRDKADKTASTSTKTSPASSKVDLNTADAATLATLPGVGPSTAQAIIAARPFASVDDVERVAGIGSAKLAAMRDQVTVSTRSATTAKKSSGDATSKSTTTTTTARPSEKMEPTGRTAASRPGAPAKKINLNTATLAELEALPEIGPVKAQAIIEARPFASIEDVKRVTGIKEGTFDEIKDQITVK